MKSVFLCFVFNIFFCFQLVGDEISVMVKEVCELETTYAKPQPNVSPVKFKPTIQNLSKFYASVLHIDNIDVNDIDMRKANIVNAISEISPDIANVAEIAPEEALSIFFGSEDAKSIDKMESFLINAEKINSEELWRYRDFTEYMDEEDQRAFIGELYGVSLKKHNGGRFFDKANKKVDERFKVLKQKYLDSLNFTKFWDTANKYGIQSPQIKAMIKEQEKKEKIRMQNEKIISILKKISELIVVVIAMFSGYFCIRFCCKKFKTKFIKKTKK